jgi:hypothetical protein
MRQDSPRGPYNAVRVKELNNLQAGLMKKKPHIYHFSWGQLLSGHKEGFPEGHRIHPGLDAAVLWADMMLYYLNRLKSSSSRNGFLG